MTVANIHILITIIRCWCRKAHWTIFWWNIWRAVDYWCLRVDYCHIKGALSWVSRAISCLHHNSCLPDLKFAPRCMTIDNFKTSCSIISRWCCKADNFVFWRYIGRTFEIWCLNIDINHKGALSLVACIVMCCHCYSCFTWWEFGPWCMTICYFDLFSYIITCSCGKASYRIFLGDICWTLNHRRMYIEDCNIKCALGLVSIAVNCSHSNKCLSN